LLGDKREEARQAHHAVQTTKAEYDRAVQKAAELAALLAKIEPRCPLCHKEMAGYDHDACLPPDVKMAARGGVEIQTDDGLENEKNKKELGADLDFARSIIDTFASYPVYVGELCYHCRKPFAPSDKGRICCYKPWKDGQFWHLACNDALEEELRRDQEKEAAP